MADPKDKKDEVAEADAPQAEKPKAEKPKAAAKSKAASKPKAKEADAVEAKTDDEPTAEESKPKRRGSAETSARKKDSHMTITLPTFGEPAGAAHTRKARK